MSVENMSQRFNCISLFKPPWVEEGFTWIPFMKFDHCILKISEEGM